MFSLKLKPISLAVMTVLTASSFAYAADGVIKAEKVEVVSTTPLKGIGVTLDKVPSNIQLIKTEDLKAQQSLSLADYMNDNLQGVSVVETQGNPFQPDVTFRGYSVSPLLGGQTGISMYLDGVRVNEPFGDGVNWDLIPMNAISGMTVIPGSNPLFGLNTLGGAMSLTTKSGRTNPGGSIEVQGGSWGRKSTTAEFGGVSPDGSVDYYVSGSLFNEDGWRKNSNSDVRQFFTKVGWQNEKTRIDFSYTGIHNDLVGNGTVPREFMQAQGRDAIYTKPDQTLNTLSFVNLSGSHWIKDNLLFSGNAYYRKSNRRSLNGDINDTFELRPTSSADATPVSPYDATQEGYCIENRTNLGANPGSGDSDEMCPGAINRAITRQESVGVNGQLSLDHDFAGKNNQVTVGAFYATSRMYNEQSREYGTITEDRGVSGVGVTKSTLNTKLRGDTDTWSLFATDTFSLNEQWHLTLSGRYNRAELDNQDMNYSGTAKSSIYTLASGGTINSTTGNASAVTRTYVYSSLTGKHTYDRFNPAIGLTFTPKKDLTVYGSYNEGNRAPTSMELGCADPLVPCKLPNQMAGDPELKQVVAKTFEGGLRGNLTSDIKWNLAAYRSELEDDIQFVSSTSTANGMGYFNNVGKTRRVGLDAGLSGMLGKLSWSAGYSYVDATYESDFDLVNSVNSETEQVRAALSNGNLLFNSDKTPIYSSVIHVKKGNQMAGIPEHQLKLRLQYAMTDKWNVGSNITAFSDRYAHGNENNADTSGNGKTAGFVIVNLDTQYNIGSGWSAFGKVINMFDRDYETGSMMGQSLFNSAGTFTGVETNTSFVSPGAPRAGWVGIRYEFGSAKKSEVARD